MYNARGVTSVEFGVEALLGVRIPFVGEAGEGMGGRSQSTICLRTPTKLEDTDPYMPLTRKNLLLFWGVLKQVVVKGFWGRKGLGLFRVWGFGV